MEQINYVSGGGTPWQNVGTLIIDPAPTLNPAPAVTLTDNTQSSSYYFVGDAYTRTVTGPTTPANLPVSLRVNGIGQGLQGYLFNGTYTASGSWTAADAGSYLEEWYVAGVPAAPPLLFGVLPASDTSGPPSIPNSFTAVFPDLPCHDITGNWIVAGAGGIIGAEWDLTQTGNAVQGTTYIPTATCGVVGTAFTGSLNGNTFNLSSSSNSACTMPAATAAVTITGSSCSVGSGVVPGVGSITLQTKKGTSNPIPTTNPPTAHYKVSYAAYIPVDHVFGPLPCLYNRPLNGSVGILQIYRGDANLGSYRAGQSVVILPDAARDYNFHYNAGPTRSFGFGAPANGLNANLDSYPLTSDIYGGAYGGADEDGVQFDCFKWHNAGHGKTDNMQTYDVSYPYGTQAQVHVYGSVANPLELGPPIAWDMRVAIDDSDPAHPTASVNYTHTCYPAHIVKVNGTVVYSYQPPRNDTVYLTRCLAQLPYIGDKVIGQSNPVAIPLQ